jgi:hypothetical protein
MRHSACLLPVVSVGPVSQSCGYSAWTRRSSPAHPAHQRVAGVIVGEREDEARLLHRGLHLLGFREAHRQRLVADHMNAGFEKRISRARVHVVRRNDGHRFDAVLACRLRLRHRFEIVINTIGREAERSARAPGLFWR